MSQTFSASTLKRIAEELLEGREFFVSALVERVREAANAFPHDGAIRTAQLIVEKRATKAGPLATMTQNEFQSIYNDVCGLGNKVAFRDLLGDLLLDGPNESSVHYNERFASSIRGSDTEIVLADVDLVEEMSGLFDMPSKTSIGSFIDNGRKGVMLELEALGYPRTKVEVATKNDKFVIYAASLDTNRGLVSTFIPAEIKMSTVLMPSVFVSSAGLEQLTAENLQRNIDDTNVSSKIPHPQKILELLTSASDQTGNLDKIAYMPEVSLNSTELFDIDRKVEMPAALSHISDSFVNEILTEAGLSFDPKVVALAKGAVANELNDMGVSCRKVIVASEFDGGLMIGATISGFGGNKTIEVPVEVVADKVLMPSIFTSGTIAKPFDKESITSFAMNRDEGTFSTAMSDKSFMNFKDLHKLVLKSAAFGNFVEAEETLAVIADQYGDSYHKVAFDDLMGLLNVGFGTEEKPQNVMDKYIKEALDKSRDREANIKMSTNLMYLHPED